MIGNFENAITFYFSTIVNFLISEPIIYFTCGFFSLLIIKIIRELKNI